MQLEWLPALCLPWIRSACGIKMDRRGFNPCFMIQIPRWQTHWLRNQDGSTWFQPMFYDPNSKVTNSLEIFEIKRCQIDMIFLILVPKSLVSAVFCSKAWDQINIWFTISQICEACVSAGWNHRGAHLSMQDLLGSWVRLMPWWCLGEMIDEYAMYWQRGPWRILKMSGVIVNSYNKRLDGS